MMRKTITRTLAISKIYAYSLEIVDGKPITKELTPIEAMGKVTEKEALKELKEIHGKDKAISINKIEVEENTYEISVTDFLAHAKKIEKTVNETEETK